MSPRQIDQRDDQRGEGERELHDLDGTASGVSRECVQGPQSYSKVVVQAWSKVRVVSRP
jgi:hypothetical protein